MPIWENPSSRPQPRNCASRASPSRTWDSCIAVFDSRNPARALARRGRLRGQRRAPGRARRAAPTPSSSCTGRSAPARPPSLRHLLAALGVEGRVKSPTYTLMEPYRSDSGHGDFPIAHFDFYRFDDDQEWEDAGFRDVFAEPGLKLVEWPEKAEALLPRCDLRLTIAAERAERGPRAADRGAQRPRRGAARMTVSASRRQALRAMGALALLPRRARAGIRRRDRRRARLAGGGLHPRDDRVGRGALGEALPRREPVAAGDRRRRPRAQPAAARAGRQGQARRPVHRRRARRPEPAAGGAAGDRPEAGDRAAAVHAGAGRGLSPPAGLRPASGQGARPAAGPDPRQGAGRGARRRSRSRMRWASSSAA